jgi:hypothetical protein
MPNTQLSLCYYEIDAGASPTKHEWRTTGYASTHFEDIFEFQKKNHLCNSWKDVFAFNVLGIVIQILSIFSHLSVVDIYCNKCKVDGSL